MDTFLFDEIIFGPVKSRRLGISLGINLLPTNLKVCNFNCIYCECGWTDMKATKFQFHSRQEVAQCLEEVLRDMKTNDKSLDVITFAGNGEPTIHPEFEGIIDDTIALRNQFFPLCKVAVLSNATMLHKPAVVSALKKIEQNILKIDSVFEKTVNLHNKPLSSSFTIEKTIQQIAQFEGNFIAQTMFLRGKYEGSIIDNTTENEVSEWLKVIEKLQPKQVMIYTIARNTPATELEKISLEDLEKIANRVRKLGIDTQVSG